MRKIILPALTLTIIAAVAIAAPGVTTTNVNFRSGPGTNFSAIRTIPVGTSIDIGDCDEAGSWCAVHGRGKEGIRQRPIPEELPGSLAPRLRNRQGPHGALLAAVYRLDFRTIEALVADEYVKAADAQLTCARRIAPAEISLTNTGG